MHRAVAGFAEAGPGFPGLRTASDLTAAWPEADLNRPDAARARARSVLDAYGDEERRKMGSTWPRIQARPGLEDSLPPARPMHRCRNQARPVLEDTRAGRAPPYSTPISSGAHWRPPRYTTVSTAR